MPAEAQPYPPGWIDRLNAWLQRLPVPGWLPLLGAWLALYAFRTVAAHDHPYPEGVSTLLMSAVLTGTGFWALIFSQVLASSARDMMRRMRPMLGVSDDEFSRLENEALTAPARPTLGASLCGVPLAVLTTIIFLPAPPGVGLGLTIDALGYLFQWTVFGAMFYQIFRTIKLVTRLQAQHAEVDLFEPGPLYAFSGWTAQIVAFIMVSWLLWTLPGGIKVIRQDPVGQLTVRAIWMGVTILIFWWPLRGAHQRLQDEKECLLAVNGRHMRSMIEQMHASAEANDLERVKVLGAALASLAHEREVLSTISTWPWRLGSLRLVTTAVLLPIAVTVLEEIVKLWVP